MKTTLDLSDDLLQRAKQAALDRNTTLRAVVEEALARALGPATDPDVPVRTITYPPASAARGHRLTAETIDDAIASQRADPADVPDRLARRMGAATSARRVR